MDGCTVLESGFYKLEEPPILLTGAILSPSFLPALRPPAVILPPPSRQEHARLELARTWQFSRRTALPVRAPSLDA